MRPKATISSGNGPADVKGRKVYDPRLDTADGAHPTNASYIAWSEDGERLAGIIIRETGSLGVRVFPSIHRFLAEREEKEVEVELAGRAHRARVKVSRLEKEIISIKAEYEDCRRIAQAAGLPLREISQKVEEAGRRAFNMCHPF